MGFVPHLSDYVDIAKLPAPETISRHLSPMVASGAVKDDGLLMESAGPVTTMQALLVTAISAGAAAVPLVEQRESLSFLAFPGQGNPVQKPFTAPWNQGALANPPAPAASSAPGVAAPSPGGTPPVASRQEDTGAEEKEGSRCLKF